MGDITDNEKQIILEKTEDAMLTGFSRATDIGKITGVVPQTASKNMKLVQEKWERTKGINIEEKRKSLLRKLEKVERDLEIIASAAKNDNAKVGAINTKLRAFERQAKLLGLDIETIRHEKPKDRMSPESFDAIEKQLEEREKPDENKPADNQAPTA